MGPVSRRHHHTNRGRAVKLLSLGLHKHELQLPQQIKALFSNERLAAVVVNNHLYASFDRKLPSTHRHIHEWATSHDIPETEIISTSSKNLERLLCDSFRVSFS